MINNFKKLFLIKKPFIDEQGKLFGRIDIFKPLFLIISLTLVIFIARVLLQKDEYVTVELFASGGEWWWENPEPPYWLADPIIEGSKEYDPQGNVLVEVLDTQKFEVGQRKMVWIKARLKVASSKKSQQFRFRREPLQIGSLIFIAPNNVKIFCNVMSIDGIGVKKTESEKTVTLKEYDMFPWHVDAMNVGDTMKDDSGKVIAEILEKKIEDAETTTTDFQGNLLVKRNPLRKDITLKIRLKTISSNNTEYFSFFQPLKVGFYLWMPFEKVNVNGNLVSIE